MSADSEGTTYLDTANVPEEQRGRLMGHAKRTVTAKHDTDEQVETDRAAVERIALWWSPRGGCPESCRN
jgi:hypothetical protein